MKNELERATSWKPRRTEWALQKQVVDEIIPLLEDPKSTLDMLAQTIDGLQAIGRSTREVKDSINMLCYQVYKTPFVHGGREMFLADMRNQKVWLDSLPGNMPPANFWRFQDSRQEYERIVARNPADNAKREISS